MVRMLSGNESAVAAVADALGKKIDRVDLDKGNDRDTLRLHLADGTTLLLWDGGQSCCESRYMSTDDDLKHHHGETLMGVEIADGPSVEDEYGDHEQQFLRVKTTGGVITVVTHNEHNGYYGGFHIEAATEPTP